jgi:hypothetical protein
LVLNTMGQCHAMESGGAAECADILLHPGASAATACMVGLHHKQPMVAVVAPTWPPTSRLGLGTAGGTKL